MKNTTLTFFAILFLLQTNFVELALAKSARTKSQISSQQNSTANKKKSSAKFKSPATQVSKNKQEYMGTKLGTDFNFEGANVHGQYKAAFEGHAIAENDKPLDDILDYRKSMSDRIQNSKGQR